MAINVENKNAGWQKHEKARNNATGTSPCALEFVLIHFTLLLKKKIWYRLPIVTSE